MRRRTDYLLLLMVITLPAITVAEKSILGSISDTVQNVTSSITSTIESTADDAIEAISPADPNAYRKVVQGNVSPTAGSPSTSIAENDPDSGTTTEGVLIVAEKYLHPIAQLFWLFLDSFLRNTRNEMLPCTITSWIPLEAYCTPIRKK